MVILDKAVHDDLWTAAADYLQLLKDRSESNDRINDLVALGERLIQNLGYQIIKDYGDGGEISAVQIGEAKVALFDRLVEPAREQSIDLSKTDEFAIEEALRAKD